MTDHIEAHHLQKPIPQSSVMSRQQKANPAKPVDGASFPPRVTRLLAIIAEIERQSRQR